MKKLISLILTLVVACSFCVVSFANGVESTGGTTAEVGEIDLETRRADPIINSAIEAVEVLNEINAETHRCYLLEAGDFAERAEYLDTIQLGKEQFKEQIKKELDEEISGGIVDHLGIKDYYNQPTDKPEARSVREQIHQVAQGILFHSTDEVVVHASLDAIVFSASGAAGSYIYERILSYEIEDSGGLYNVEYELLSSTGVGTNSADLSVSGYNKNLLYFAGQVHFGVDNM